MKRYQLEIRACIREVDPSGHPMYPSGLELQETSQLGPMGFLNMTEVLGALHKAIRRIKVENEDV